MAQDIGYGWGYTDSHTEPVDVPEDYEDFRNITDDSGNVLYLIEAVVGILIYRKKREK